MGKKANNRLGLSMPELRILRFFFEKAKDGVVKGYSKKVLADVAMRKNIDNFIFALQHRSFIKIHRNGTLRSQALAYELLINSIPKDLIPTK